MDGHKNKRIQDSPPFSLVHGCGSLEENEKTERRVLAAPVTDDSDVIQRYDLTPKPDSKEGMPTKETQNLTVCRRVQWLVRAIEESGERSDAAAILRLYPSFGSRLCFYLLLYLSSMMNGIVCQCAMVRMHFIARDVMDCNLMCRDCYDAVGMLCRCCN